MPGGKTPKHRKNSEKAAFPTYRKKYKLVLVFACVIINTVSMLAGSYTVHLLPIKRTDLRGWQRTKLLRSLLIMACIYLFDIVAQYLQARIMIGISQQAIFKTKERAFCQNQKLPVTYLRRKLFRALLHLMHFIISPLFAIYKQHWYSVFIYFSRCLNLCYYSSEFPKLLFPMESISVRSPSIS